MSRAGSYGIKRVDAFQEHMNELFLKNKTGGDEINYSYEKDIEPFLLKTYIEHELAVKNAFAEAEDINSLLEIIEKKYIRMLSSCWEEDAELDKKLEKEFSKFITNDGELDIAKFIQYMNDCNGIGKYLVSEQDENGQPILNIEKHYTTLWYFDYFVKEIKIKKTLSGELFPLIEDFIKYILTGFSKFVAPDIVNGVISSYCMKYDKTALLKVNPTISEYFVIKNNALLVQNVNFNSYESINIYEELLDNRYGIFEEIGIKNCVFNHDIERTATSIELPIFFYDCVFNKRFSVFYVAPNRHLCFLKCKFLGQSEFGACTNSKHMPYVLDILNCYFGTNSATIIANIQDEPDVAENMVHIENTIINGTLAFSNISKKSETNLNLKNVALMKPFTVDKCYFSKYSRFQNVSFNAEPSQELDDSMNQFANSLMASGLQAAAEQAGIIKTNYEAPEEFDIQAYKIACESGFLRPKYAAYYLGMSKDNLARKRMADKQQITRETIPYIGDGKSITYPLEALHAFKIQDWDTLKKLREKYRKNESKSTDTE